MKVFMAKRHALGFGRLLAGLVMVAIGLAFAMPALADSMVGAPAAWGMGLQPSGGVIKERISSFNTMVFVIITVITIFVLVLLAYCVWRFSAERNPVPSTTSHHTGLEIAWTVIPVLILIVIAIPSFRLLYFQDRAVDADMTITVQGRQWYWNYTYSDQGNFTFDSYPIQEADLKPGQIFKLSVDNELVIPVGANIRVLTTGHDVIHSFFVPALGIQKYTIPGRTLETWMRADRPGIFYGQCNQICGTNHWFMPIAVRAVPRAEFDSWVNDAKKRFAQADGSAPAMAAAPAAQEVVQIAEARR
ncbi:MAG: cytochrome c oxidase subunit II [Roseomonas sp.]|nr:cytochrome c oxidase subunit II [Roseomonas sp.]